MAGLIEARLAAAGIALETPPAPFANYLPFVVSGSSVVISGQLPLVAGRLGWTGKLGLAVSVAEGQAAARQCFVNVLAQLRAACGGDLDRVRRLLRLGGFIAAAADFTRHPEVMNGASDLAVTIFAEAGRHARSTIGVSSLPLDAPVEVEAWFELV